MTNQKVPGRQNPTVEDISGCARSTLCDWPATHMAPPGLKQPNWGLIVADGSA